jgi:hypothetical protein
LSYLNCKGISSILTSVIIFMTFISLSFLCLQYGMVYLRNLECNLRSGNVVDFLRYVRLKADELSFINDSVIISNSHYIIKLNDWCDIMVIVNDVCLGNFTSSILDVQVYASSPKVYYDQLIQINGTCLSIYEYGDHVYLTPALSLRNFGSRLYLRLMVFRGSGIINGNFILKVGDLLKSTYMFECADQLKVSLASSNDRYSTVIALSGPVILVFEVVFVDVVPI